MAMTREANRLEQPSQDACAVGTWMMAPGLGNMDTPAAASTPSPAVQRRGRSDAMWEAHKPILRALYLDQGRSLKEVMEIMKSNHGLEAS